MATLGDEFLFETDSQICAKLNNGEIDLSTPHVKMDDLFSRTINRCEVSDVYDCPKFA